MLDKYDFTNQALQTLLKALSVGVIRSQMTIHIKVSYIDVIDFAVSMISIIAQKSYMNIYNGQQKQGEYISEY